MEIAAGTVLQDRYRILEPIAEGAMGSVYRAERLKLGRQVAIKFLHPTLAADPEFIRRFEREAKTMSRLSHPHCVSVIDFGVDEGRPYIVMEHVSGNTLREMLDQGKMPVGRALHIFRQVLGGLAHAHGQGIIHRDVKPANMILTEATGTGDHVRILDFGLAKLWAPESSLAGGGEGSTAWLVVGTPNYMSPEQSRADQVDARSDVYSAGIVLFELLTGIRPFEAEESSEILRKQREEPPPRLRELQSELSPELEAVVLKALQKAPADRYDSARDFARALDEVPEATRAWIPDEAYDETQAAARSSKISRIDVTGAERKHSSGAGATIADRPRFQRGGTSEVLPTRSRLWPTLFFLVLIAGASGLWFLSQGREDREGGDDLGALLQQGKEASSDPRLAAALDGAPGPTVAVEPDGAPPAVDAAPVMEITLEETLDASALPEEQIEPEADDKVPLPPEELEEPVAAVEEDVPDDAPERPVAPPAPADASAVTPDAAVAVKREVRTLDDAKLAIREGRREDAIAGLTRLRRSQPKSAYIPYLLGNLYFEKRWWSDGLKNYEVAIKYNRSYRKRSVLNQNVIRALGSKKTRAKAASLILRSIGKAAMPYLRHAVRTDKNAEVRRRADTLYKKLASSSSSKRKRRF